MICSKTGLSFKVILVLTRNVQMAVLQARSSILHSGDMVLQAVDREGTSELLFHHVQLWPLSPIKKLPKWKVAGTSLPGHWGICYMPHLQCLGAPAPSCAFSCPASCHSRQILVCTKFWASLWGSPSQKLGFSLVYAWSWCNLWISQDASKDGIDANKGPLGILSTQWDTHWLWTPISQGPQ